MRDPPGEGLEPWNLGQLSKVKRSRVTYEKGLSCDQPASHYFQQLGGISASDLEDT